MTAQTMEVNPEVIEQKIGVVFGALGGLVTSSMIHVGHELGLYRAMAGKGPITAARLAADAGLIERFVGEWLAQQAASGIVESRGGGLFELSPESALVFADENNPASQIAFFRISRRCKSCLFRPSSLSGRGSGRRTTRSARMLLAPWTHRSGHGTGAHWSPRRCQSSPD